METTVGANALTVGNCPSVMRQNRRESTRSASKFEAFSIIEYIAQKEFFKFDFWIFQSENLCPRNEGMR